MLHTDLSVQTPIPYARTRFRRKRSKLGRWPYAYDQLNRVLNEIAAPFDHLYAYGTEKCEILNLHLKRPIHNYEDLKCPDPSKLTSDVRCYLNCHKFPHLRCATKNSFAAHKWLVYLFQKKSYRVIQRIK